MTVTYGVVARNVFGPRERFRSYDVVAKDDCDPDGSGNVTIGFTQVRNIVNEHFVVPDASLGLMLTNEGISSRVLTITVMDCAAGVGAFDDYTTGNATPVYTSLLGY